MRSIGVTEVTYYRWRQEYGGLKTEQIKRLKELETGNARLRRAVAEAGLGQADTPEQSRCSSSAPVSCARRLDHALASASTDRLDRVCSHGLRPAAAQIRRRQPWPVR